MLCHYNNNHFRLKYGMDGSPVSCIAELYPTPSNIFFTY